MEKRQGISLIVLVITIIVMIILAAAIIISLNNSGIIGKAQTAADKTSKANEEEEMQVLYGEVLLAKYTNTGKRDVGDYLSTGWSGENGKYYSPSGDIYEEVNSKMVNTGTKGAYEGSDTELYVRDIYSESDLIHAITNDNERKMWNSQIWNIQDDITLTEDINVNAYGSLDLTINGNGHTIYGSDDTDSTFAKFMFEFNSNYVANNNNRVGELTVKINDLNIVSGYHFRHVIQAHMGAGAKSCYVRLNNVTIDHSKSTSQKTAGVPIQCNSAEIKIQNNFTLITGQRSWAGIDIDKSNGNPKITFASNAKVAFTDNRTAEKKAEQPFFVFGGDSETNTITFTNLSSYTMNHVIKESSSKEGYDI